MESHGLQGRGGVGIARAMVNSEIVRQIRALKAFDWGFDASLRRSASIARR